MSTSLRAPAHHGEILLYPTGPLESLVQTSEASLERSLGGERLLARREVQQLATRYTHRLVGLSDVSAEAAYWVIGGHQPELFHPGVWVKNAVISRLAQQTGGFGLQLVVDNDLCPGAAVRVPLAPDARTMTTLDWDVHRPQCPWEERSDPDQEQFGSFGDRCGHHLRPWGIEPLAVSQSWRGGGEDSLVDRLVRMRAVFERQIGGGNSELKVSELAETNAFRRFVARAISETEALRTAYHSALFRYRSLNHIRSSSHPVPELAAAAGRLELPFWIWRTGDQQRGRLFVESVSSRQRRLFADQRDVGILDFNSVDKGAEELERLTRAGWKIRPRALTLTLFCRLYLGSVFVHGIGGAKYDEMTDDLMHAWLGITPPPFIVATATLRLFEAFAGPSPESEIDSIQHQLRMMQWNPESYASPATTGSNWEQLRQEKTECLTSAMEKQRRHQSIHRVNMVFRAALREDESRLRMRLKELLEQRPYQTALRSREFSANLFPADELRQLFQHAADQVSPAENRALPYHRSTE